MSTLWGPKLQTIILSAVAGLAPDDRAERMAYCREHDEHGVRAFPEGEAVWLRWGGRDLAVVERRVLADDDAPLPEFEWIDAAPDTIPDEWTE